MDMFEVNDIILYGVDGVCRICDVVNRSVGKETIRYYVLKSCGQEKTTVYVPTENEKLVSKMRKVISSDEAMELIRSMPGEETIWIDDENTRKALYNEILSGSDRHAIIKVIKTLYLHRREMKQQNRKLHAVDENLLRQAEKRLYDEFAHALDMQPEHVLPFIMEQIDGGAEVAFG